jgi:hypothetical protein
MHARDAPPLSFTPCPERDDEPILSPSSACFLSWSNLVTVFQLQFKAKGEKEKKPLANSYFS